MGDNRDGGESSSVGHDAGTSLPVGLSIRSGRSDDRANFPYWTALVMRR